MNKNPSTPHMTAHSIESMVRSEFDKVYNTNTIKSKRNVGKKGPFHEFDLYEINKIIGGVNSSPWLNQTGSNNTGGQDRAATELLWLSLWQGSEKRVLVLTDKNMALNLFKKFSGCNSPIKLKFYTLT